MMVHPRKRKAGDAVNRRRRRRLAGLEEKGPSSPSGGPT